MTTHLLRLSRESLKISGINQSESVSVIEPFAMLDKGLRLIQQATDLQHVPGPVLKRNAQFPLDRRFIKADKGE
jgi:hypothetical protein